ncbi:MAG: HTH-type transcriptional regulator MhqR [Pelotomaculum sp. PtaB.Bin104]|nr:MAG: HTH-type transcriptional regulator MhqR [Pelotomaculum sp. PtaB.Bin104]
MRDLEELVSNFLVVLADMRDKFIRPADLIARSRLGPLQFYALSVLYREGSLSMSELAGEMQVSKQQLTPLVDRLIENGLLVRKADENDRRKVLLAVTGPGRGLYDALYGEITYSIAEKFKTLPLRELEELEQLLKRGHEILKSIN